MNTSQSVDEVFDYLADVSNFAEWDPGTRGASQVEGNGPGIGAAYDLEVAAGPSTVLMHYRVEEFDAPRCYKMVGTTRFLRSVDEIHVAASTRTDNPATSGGTDVTYEADLTMQGPISRLVDPFLGLLFKVLGDRAAQGLADRLQGHIVR